MMKGPEEKGKKKLNKGLYKWLVVPSNSYPYFTASKDYCHEMKITGSLHVYRKSKNYKICYAFH